MNITIHVNPVAKPRMVHSDSWKKRPCVLKYWAYKDDLLLALTLDQREKLSKAEEFNKMEFYVAMPKSWSDHKKMQHLGRPHQQTPDIDNYLKGFFDAVMIEDKQIWRIRDLGKWWSNDPRVEVVI